LHYKALFIIRMKKHRYTNIELAMLHKEAENAMKKIAGVTGVGFGIKEKSGELTEFVAFRIYVEKKKSDDQLKVSELIPQTIFGFRTDVIEVRSAVNTSCEDNSKTRPIVGGLTISNLRNPTSNPLAFEPGTLGYFATINGNNTKDRIAFITNMHVVAANGGQEGNPIYQPKLPANLDKERGDTAIGHVLRALPIDNYIYRYPDESLLPAHNYYLDCASVKVATDYSSCCGKNKGIDYNREIKNLNIKSSNTIAGIQRVEFIDLIEDEVTARDYPVFKVGRMTSRTVGKIVDVATPGVRLNGVIAQNLISVRATENNCNGEMKFQEPGDSGAVLVNSSHNIVGLLCAMNPASPFDAYASHIHPVMDKLGLTIIPNTIGSAGGQRLIGKDEFVDIKFLDRSTEQQKFAEIKNEFLSRKEIAEFYQLVLKHQDEVVNLINYKRPVTVAWHRLAGPAFTAQFVKSFHESGYEVPAVIKGLTLKQFFYSLKKIFYEYGSNELKKTIELHGDDIIERFGDCRDFESLLLSAGKTTLQYE